MLFNQYFAPDVAASGQRFTDVAEALAEAHEVTAIVGRASTGSYLHLWKTQGTPLSTRSPEFSTYGGTTPSVFRVWSTSFSRRRRLARITNYVTYLASAAVAGLFRRRPDVVIAGTDPPLVGLVATVVSRLRGAPLVYLLWDVHPQAALAAEILRAGFIARVVARSNRIVLRAAAVVVVPTASMGQTAVELGADPDRVKVIPLWEDTENVVPAPKDNAFSRRHGLADRFVLMYSGNLGLTQGLERYLDLAVRLKDLDDVVTVFVGDGAGKLTLEARARAIGLSSVVFLPYQPREEMRFSLAAADVLLAPSRTGLTKFMHPSKVYTCMASGRPFVAAIDLVSDLADVIRRLDCGRVVAPEDLDAVEREIRWFHAHRDARLEMGHRGRRAAEAEFSKAVVTPRFLDLVDALGAVEAVEAGGRS